MLMSPQYYDNESTVKYAIQKSFARDYYNYSHCLCIQLFVHRVVSFFPNKRQKMNTVSQTESRTLLQHHSFKNSITLRPGWTKGLQSKLRKLSSVREFVTRPTAAAALQCYFILFFFSNLFEIPKTSVKLGDKIVCSEITEFIFL